MFSSVHVYFVLRVFVAIGAWWWPCFCGFSLLLLLQHVFFGLPPKDSDAGDSFDILLENFQRILSNYCISVSGCINKVQSPRSSSLTKLLLSCIFLVQISHLFSPFRTKISVLSLRMSKALRMSSILGLGPTAELADYTTDVIKQVKNMSWVYIQIIELTNHPHPLLQESNTLIYDVHPPFVHYISYMCFMAKKITLLACFRACCVHASSRSMWPLSSLLVLRCRWP